MRTLTQRFRTAAVALVASMAACGGTVALTVDEATDASHAKDAAPENAIDQSPGDARSDDARSDDVAESDWSQSDCCAPWEAHSHCPVPQVLSPEPGDPAECVYDLEPVFDYLADAEVHADPSKVDVTVNEPDGGTSALMHVPYEYLCTNVDGWYWQDESKTHVVLCPPACNHVRKEHAGQINFVFGCSLGGV